MFGGAAIVPEQNGIPVLIEPRACGKSVAMDSSKVTNDMINLNKKTFQF